MSRRRIELTGQRFGHLTVIKLAPHRGVGRNGNLHYVCRCDCGNFIVVRSDNLRMGHTTQCHDCSTNGTKSIFAKVGDENGVV